MKRFHAHCISETRIAREARCTAGLLPLLLLAASAQAAEHEETAAVLKHREVDFFYRSSAVIFSCNDLENRVVTILRALGAREDVGVTVTGCDAFLAPEPMDETWETPSSRSQNPSGGWTNPADRWRATPSDSFSARSEGRQQSARVHVRAMLPVEATPEVIDEMEKDKSRRELISRVTGNPSAALNDPIVFPAQRQLVNLSRETIRLEPEDCELLEQMGRSAFRKLDMRVVRKGPTCDRSGASHLPPQMTVEALMPVMPTAPQILPAPGEPDPSAPATSNSEPAESPTEPAPE